MSSSLPSPKDVSDASAQENATEPPKSPSWAEDVPSSSVDAKADKSVIPASTNAQSSPPTATEAESSLVVADQTDGAGGALGGASGIIEPNYEVDVKLSDVQADPNNPLYSIKSFEELGLHEDILKGIYQMRFTKPSKIQEKALPLLIADPPTNLIGQSQSGTGKTAAFVLNILTRLELSNPEMNTVPQALCLAPTRELARQIIGVIQLMGSFIKDLNVLPAIPLDVVNRGRELKGQIVVGTPGTVMDLIRKRLLQATRIKVLVLDEADNMLDLQGMGDQCIRVKQ